MSVAIRFEKSRAEALLHALAHGDALEPAQPGAWTRGDAIAVAGTLFFAALDQAPMPDDAHREHVEAMFDTQLRDLRSAILYHAEMVRLVRDGAYDERFEPEHAILLVTNGERDVAVAIEGCKGITTPQA